MLELKHIKKIYNPGTISETLLFEDFNLTVPDGEFFSIVGSVFYKACIQVAISLGLPANLMKLATAVLFLIILILGNKQKGGAEHA